MLTIVRALAEVALIVAVQAWMLVQVSFGYWRLCARARRAAATPVAAAPLPGDALLSVVIPAYREAATIEATLRRVLSAAADPRRVEVVVVDAGGGDGTMAAARRRPRTSRPALSVDCAPSSRGGRGPAVAAGARAARGAALLVLHGDTRLPSGFDAGVLALRDPKALATCFRFGVDRLALDGALKSPRGSLLRRLQELPFAVMEATVALRSRVLQLPFGDQALALRRDTFEALGGFDDLAKLPILEDFLLVHKLRVAGA
ncbi:hypothetical protein SO694_00002743 [Aureococcus anophagefferens]|uniref:Glycosyltransferase 2-like domain-containing protein n=1 Tax=Aureococcus anophagefferens TaxID=44056 RepID=A0ABR1GCZ1_AURAN